MMSLSFIRLLPPRNTLAPRLSCFVQETGRPVKFQLNRRRPPTRLCIRTALLFLLVCFAWFARGAERSDLLSVAAANDGPQLVFVLLHLDQNLLFRLVD